MCLLMLTMSDNEQDEHGASPAQLNRKRRYKEYLYTASDIQVPERSRRRLNVQNRVKDRRLNAENVSTFTQESHTENSADSSESGDSVADENNGNTLCDAVPVDILEEGSESVAYDSDSSTSESDSSEDSGSANPSSSGTDSSNSDSSNSDTSDSDASDEGSEIDDVVEDKIKLFEGSSMTQDEAILMVLELFKDPNMTKTLLKSVISLVHTLLPKENLTFPKSYYLLMKHLNSIAPPFSAVRHYYCSDCQCYLGLTDQIICAVCGGNKADSFFFFKVKDCIRHLFEVRNLAKVLTGNQQASTSLSDISDGLGFSEAWENIEKIPIDLTLLWNTDGVKMTQSTRLELWPLQFTICEIPPDLRQYYLIVCGIYIARKKPNLNTFLKPFVMEMKEIFEEGGVKWKDPITGIVKTSKVLAPVCSLDAPARAEALKMHLHNGEYPCSVCERRGQNLRTVRKGNKRVFPPKDQPTKYRTMKRMIKQASRAQVNKPVRGMKGLSCLYIIPRFNAPKAVIAESLHNTFAGVTRLFVKTMLTNPNGQWYVKRRIADIDKFLSNVKLPSNVGRPTRSLEEWLSYKAHEFLIWLLFLSLPALKDILNEEFLQHWMLFVRAIYLLHSDNISEADLQEAERLLQRFCDEIQSLYSYIDSDGNVQNTWLYHFNVHQLLHLVEFVRYWGPLWATAAFIFESSNGWLKSLVHSFFSTRKELVNSLQILESMRVLRNRCREAKAQTFDCVEENVKGAANTFVLVNNEERQVLLSAGFAVEDVSLYKRAISKGEIFTSRVYTRQEERNNYTVQFRQGQDHKYGEILFFFKSAAEEIFCLINVFKIDRSKMFIHHEEQMVVRHLIPIAVSENRQLTIVPFKDVSRKVINAANYIGLLPNFIKTRL